jgi:hypothetical protein
VVLNFVIRMVIPMRREFGRSLDVQQFMRDQSYAHTVLEQALGSRDERLRDYAQQVQQHLFGPRAATSPAAGDTVPGALTTEAPAAAPTVMPAVASTPAPAPAVDPTEAELRAKMLRRYTSGLR